MQRARVTWASEGGDTGAFEAARILPFASASATTRREAWRTQMAEPVCAVEVGMAFARVWGLPIGTRPRSLAGARPGAASPLSPKWQSVRLVHRSRRGGGGGGRGGRRANERKGWGRVGDVGLVRTWSREGITETGCPPGPARASPALAARPGPVRAHSAARRACSRVLRARDGRKARGVLQPLSRGCDCRCAETESTAEGPGRGRDEGRDSLSGRPRQGA